jgi:hypothetical protein
VRRIAVLSGVGVVLLVLVLAQLILPGIAEQQLRDRLSKSGQVISVQVSAFPAIELLWHHADSVHIKLASYHKSIGSLSNDLAEAGDADSLDASANVLQTGIVTLRDATLTKRGNVLTGLAHLTQSDLTSSLPFLSGVQVASAGGSLTFHGTATLFVLSAPVDATLSVEQGKLVVAPDVASIGLPTFRVFGDPRIAVQSVSATPAPDGFIVTARALLR